MNDNWKNKLKGDPLPWLLEGCPWAKYRTIIDLLDVPKTSKQVLDAKKDMLNNPNIISLIADTAQWFPTAATRHSDSKISHYKLRVLNDFGLTINDHGITEIINKVCEHTEDGLFSFRQELPQKGKGFQKPNPNTDEWHALPCDSPLITYSLLCMEHRTASVMQSIEIIKEKWSNNKGWFCHFFFVESIYKKLQIGCPMAGLMALEVFSQIPELKESQYSKNAYDPIKFHRDYGKSMYYFGRSKKFWTLKYPFVWYNALYLAEVLSRFDFLKNDELLEELINWIEDSQDDDGKFTPTSMFMNYKGWDFANKKEPSPWITFICCRILKRYYSNNNRSIA